MIVVKLIGGLGNQLFQYATGLALADKHKVELKFDYSFFTGNYNLGNVVKRNFELGIFNIDPNPATPEEVFKLTRRVSLPALDKVINKVIGPKHSYYIEKGFEFDEQLLKAKLPLFIEGFWQSEKYFRSVEKQVRETFQFKLPVDGDGHLLQKKIQETNSVSIHIRRGDYLNVKAYEICSIDYYLTAIEHLKSVVEDPVFYLFSEDIEWVKENLLLDVNFILVPPNAGENSWMDLCLMSSCKHHIIANSSFSWWAAWLNNGYGKIVVAPKKWFKNPASSGKDLIPENWVII